MAQSEMAFDKFHEIYQTMLLIQEKNLDPREMLQSTCHYLTSEADYLTQICHEAMASETASNYEIDYLSDLDAITSSLKLEKNQIARVALGIGVMHRLIYKCLTASEMAKLTLNGRQEMAVLEKDIIYHVFLNAEPQDNEIFHAFILVIMMETIFNHHLYLGVDFEFTEHEIRLAQLNFEHNRDTNSFIFILAPRQLTPEILKNFVTDIFCNRRIKKILQGSDSQDIPYIYKELLAGDATNIRNFTRSLIDTRYYCEYYKLNHGDVSKNKCTLYDDIAENSAVYYFGVVDDQQQENLARVLQTLPVDIKWRVDKLTHAQLLYAQYDVIYLKYYYYKIVNMAVLAETNPEDQRHIFIVYRYVLFEFIHFVYFEQKAITDLHKTCKAETDPFNNYFMRRGEIVKMIDVYKQVSQNLKIMDPVLTVDTLHRVNNFTRILDVVTKRLVYGHISLRCRVFKDKSNIWTDKLYNHEILDYFRKNEFSYLYRMFNSINQVLESRVLAICRSNNYN